MAGKPTRAQAKAIAARRDAALQLHLAGVDYLTIARKLAADPKLNSDGKAYPVGYGIEAYKGRRAAPDEEHLAELVRADLKRVFQQRKASIDRHLEELRDLHHERLERLFTEVYRRALAHKDDMVALAALDRALKIMERQARLHGLDAPARTEITGVDGGPVELTAVQQARDRAVAQVIELRASREENEQTLARALGPAPGDTDDDAADG